MSRLLPILLVAALVSFWLGGMFVLRSMLWLPWLALLAAITVTFIQTERGRG